MSQPIQIQRDDAPEDATEAALDELPEDPTEDGLEPELARQSSQLSLDDIHGSIDVPNSRAGFFKQWRAFAGPALLVSVGYMDPGNWGTDLQGGAQFKYGLLWVVALASVMAIFMQVLAARLGIVTGKDLAQACRDWYPRWTR
jgi:manganese transport protein